MEKELKDIHQVINEVWKNFKHHAQEFDQNNKKSFFDDWIDDISAMDASYRNDPVRYAIYKQLIRGLVDSVEEVLKNGSIKEN